MELVGYLVVDVHVSELSELSPLRQPRSHQVPLRGDSSSAEGRRSALSGVDSPVDSVSFRAPPICTRYSSLIDKEVEGVSDGLLSMAVFSWH